MPSLVLTLSLSAHAATRVVPDNFPVIQDAINAAGNGDIIQFNTTVPGDFTITGKQLTLQGAGAWVGTLSATGGANVTIKGMSLLGGPVETDTSLIQLGQYCQSLTPAAVDANNAVVNITNSDFSCYVTAVNSLQSDLTIDGSNFTYNYFGGAVFHKGGDLHIETSNFSYNGGFEGGAVHAESDTAEILTSGFYANTTSLGEGGGLFVKADQATVEHNEFSNNYNLIWWVPGLVINDPTDLLGQDVAGLVVGVGDGAGMYVTDPALAPASSVYIHDNTYCGNLADRGAGLFLNGVAGAQVANNRFADNWSMHEGGALVVKADEPWDTSQENVITNNTFLTNTAGLIPPPYPSLTTEIGAGGAVALLGTVVDFRNNVVAYSPFGGGVMGKNGIDYTIGDLVQVDYNIFFWNCDAQGCAGTDPLAWRHFTSDMNSYALPATNIQLDPFPVYFGGGEFNCVPDAFYPEWGSPAVRNGDVNLPNKFSPDFSDIGSYGGPDANVLDRDGDGFENIYDCDDEPGGEQVGPGQPEICDGLDNDCDGTIDEGFPTLWYPDDDGDGFGDIGHEQPVEDCGTPAGMVSNRDDCDDEDPAVHPGVKELCDGVDNDCDFAIDGGLPFLALWKDLDGDGYGGATGEQYNGCSAQDQNQGSGMYYVIGLDGTPQLSTAGFVENHDDCNDFDLNVSPVAVEACDGKDNDCNGVVDDSSQDGTLFYIDGDHDGYGTTASGAYSCGGPGPNSVEKGGDCDDFNREISPAEPEVCDGIDNDCDGTVDKNAANAELLYEDQDGDGYGNDATAARDCNPGPTYTTRIGGDCDDNDAAIGVCSKCGCQSTPTPLQVGGIAGLLTLVLSIRRRKLS